MHNVTEVMQQTDDRTRFKYCTGALNTWYTPAFCMPQCCDSKTAGIENGMKETT